MNILGRGIARDMSNPNCIRSQRKTNIPHPIRSHTVRSRVTMRNKAVPHIERSSENSLSVKLPQSEHTHTSAQKRTCKTRAFLSVVLATRPLLGADRPRGGSPPSHSERAPFVFFVVFLTKAFLIRRPRATYTDGVQQFFRARRKAEQQKQKHLFEISGVRIFWHAIAVSSMFDLRNTK